MEIYYLRCKNLKNQGLALNELNEYKNFKGLFTQYEFNLIMNEKQNRKNKRYRTKQKFLEIYNIARYIDNDNKKIVFGTMTLDNKHLSQKEDTYMRKINKWLKRHFIYSIVNKDFGTKTEREHYHFIGITIEDIEAKGYKSKKGYEIYELKQKDYELGFEPTLCLIDLKKNDIEKTTNYLLKLNNHSTKITTKNRLRVIKSDKIRLLTVANGYVSRKDTKTAKYGMIKAT